MNRESRLNGDQGGETGPGHSARRHLLRLLCASMGVPLLLGSARAQEEGPGPSRPTEASSQLREWKEGKEIRVRVPVASEPHELMSAVAFPEAALRSAVTGWGQA